MKEHIINIFQAIGRAVGDTINHDGIEHGGYLAFLALLAVFPFFVFFVALTGFIGQSEIGAFLLTLFMENAPEQVTTTLKPRIEEILSGPPQGFLTIAILGTIWTASSGFEGLRTILNRAYRVNTPPAYIWRRLLSILQFIISSFVLILIMLIMLLGPNAMTKAQEFLDIQPFISPLWYYVRLGIGFLTILGIVSLSYYFLPNIKLSFSSVLPGAVTVVLMWMGLGSAFTYYLSSFHQVSIIYGSLAGIIVTLLFLYAAAIIYIFGAELNHHLLVVKKARQTLAPIKEPS